MKLAWLTDLHLNFVKFPDAFLSSLADVDAGAFLVGGDTGEAPNVAYYLTAIAEVVHRPVYFVLGNHDFYRGSIAHVRHSVADLMPNLHWLPRIGEVRLTDEACLIGHDGWGDGRLGKYWTSDVMLNDWGLIGEFGGFDEHLEARLRKLQALGDEAAARLWSLLPEALARFRHVVVLTHVPPFKEACWHEGRISDDNWLPHFTCKAVGDVLSKAMAAYPDREMTVLCGHTHDAGEAQILPNLRVLTGGAVYGQPKLQRVLEVV